MRRIFSFCLLIMLASVTLAQSTAGLQIKQQAEHGDALSQAKLASLYLLGRDGIEKNEALAAEWMEKAAQQGLVDAQVATAAMYDRGLGVTANRETSTSWYEKAAAKGHSTALALLGRNNAAEGSVQFNYQSMRLSAAKSLPSEYAKKFLTSK